MEEETQILKILSDKTRLRLMCILLARGETCVCDLATAMDEPDFKVSRHLGIMRQAGMLEVRRDGTWMYYRVREPSTQFEKSLHAFLKSALACDPVLMKDLSLLKTHSCSAHKRARQGRSSRR